VVRTAWLYGAHDRCFPTTIAAGGSKASISAARGWSNLRAPTGFPEMALTMALDRDRLRALPIRPTGWPATDHDHRGRQSRTRIGRASKSRARCRRLCGRASGIPPARSGLTSSHTRNAATCCAARCVSRLSLGGAESHNDYISALRDAGRGSLGGCERNYDCASMPRLVRRPR
jgi:hypothetical protein